MITDAATDQPSASANAAANGMNAARALPWRYRNGKSTTAVVSVAPTTAGRMRRLAAARPLTVSGASRICCTTTRPFWTRIPMPMPRPASVSRFAGMSSRKRPSAVPAIATAALPITSATDRALRSVSASTSSTATNATDPRSTSSFSCLARSTLSSLCSRTCTPAGSSGSVARTTPRTAAAVLIASAPGRRETINPTAVRPFMR